MIVVGVIVSGLILGCLAGFNSLGLVLLYRTTRLVNLAQPAMGLVGGVLAGILITWGHWSFWLAAPIGLICGAILGLVTERTVVRRMLQAPRSVLLIATIGLAAIFGGIQTALPFIFTGRTLPTYSINLGISRDIGVEHIAGPHVIALALFPVCVALMMWFTSKSRVGLQALALGQNQERAWSLGVRSGLVRSIVWTIAGLLATISGILSIPIQGFNLAGGLGPTVLLLALAPAVLAGFRSVLNAALAALAVGVGFQLVHFYVSRSSISELVFAAALLCALGLQRRVIARGESEVDATSIGGSVRPLPWKIREAPSFIAAEFWFASFVIVAAVAIPMLVSPAHRVLFAASASLAIGALSVAVMWIFAGEIGLGNWGLAGFGAAVAAFVPGHWLLRAAVASIVMAGFGALLGVVARRRSNLSFAVVGLAIAATAPVMLDFIGSRRNQAPIELVGVAAAIVAIIAVVGITVLRGSLTGCRMIAARDEPLRASELGANVVRARMIAFAISGALAGFAGALYFAVVGVAPGAFDPSRSLDILAMAIIGGMASPSGAIFGAIVVQIVRFGLPEPWPSLTTGIGVLIVLLVRPSGLSAVVSSIRDVVARRTSADQGAAA
ncbi:MAG: branched-chain amino acid ABC transporter permease [Actinomycetota bacterium]